MKDNKLKIEYVDIGELKPNEYNPKQMSEKEEKNLEKSIIEFGIVDPLIANKAKSREGIIIGGHQRYKIYQKLKLKEVPVVWLNIPDLERERELCLRLSKNTGSFDYDLLAQFDESLLEDIGFSNEELDEIFGLEIDEEFDVEKELDKVLEKKERRCKGGDLWQLGEHRLYIGSAIDRESWEKVLENERFDLLFTDPPYQLSWLKTGKGFGAKKQRKYEGTLRMGRFSEFDEWLSIANEFQNFKGANIMVFENWKNIVKLWQAIEKYWKIRNLIIWHKLNKYYSYSISKTFHNDYEIIYLAGEGIKNEEYEEELEEYLKQSGEKLLNTYEIIFYGSRGDNYFDKRRGSKWVRIHDHISSVVDSRFTNVREIAGTKPIQILVPYIKILSPRNGIVVDCFGGSGSTLISCEIMKRKCRMIELSELYAEVILARWEKFTGNQVQKIN